MLLMNVRKVLLLMLTVRWMATWLLPSRLSIIHHPNQSLPSWSLIIDHTDYCQNWLGWLWVGRGQQDWQALRQRQCYSEFTLNDSILVTEKVAHCKIIPNGSWLTFRPPKYLLWFDDVNILRWWGRGDWASGLVHFVGRTQDSTFTCLCRGQGFSPS